MNAIEIYEKAVCRLDHNEITVGEFEAEIAILKDVEPAQKWIPVAERLPEKDGIYLTFNKKKQYEFHFFQTGKRMWPAVWDEDGVTHWMPLPNPPKEGQK